MSYEQTEGNTELWATVFGPGHPDLQKQHRMHKMLPSAPRCRMCLVPFGGIGGWIMSKRGKAPSSRNPHYCNACDGFLDAFPGGAEVDMSILYVDVRNSVGTAESSSAEYVGKRINTFLKRATDVITKNDGFVMAFYGDCVVAVWPPGFSGPDHAKKAVAAAKALGAAFAGNSEVPAGTGLHTGPVYIGTVDAGKGTFRDISIFGHSVNVTARLASVADGGQALASDALASAANISTENAQSLDLKGLSSPVKVVTL
ncbi:MAG: hypothetical protein GKR98_16470 [Boseongicola sp.]|nr:MAG: hypothetical protein GKR98_16470 [Boseongicola sp.]